MDKEYILCSAIWYKELPTAKLLPKNIDSGIVVCGWRHGNCINTMMTLGKLRTVTFSDDGVGEHEQRFLTNNNRFVDRTEARNVAFEAGQLAGREVRHRTELFSEDVW